LLGVEKRRSRPALDHLAITPAGHPIGLAARGGIGIFDDVGAAQRATQRGREPEPVDGEHFLQAFTQAARRVRVFTLQPGGLLFELGDPFFRPEPESGAHGAGDLGLQVRRQMETGRRPARPGHSPERGETVRGWLE